MSYMTISSQENHHFSLCSYFHAHPTTLLLKILGGPMHGPSPTSNFGGTVPPVPLGLRLCSLVLLLLLLLLHFCIGLDSKRDDTPEHILPKRKRRKQGQ